MKTHQRQLVDILANHFKVDGFYCGCEVGIWKGETSRVLLEQFPDLFLYMVDRFLCYPPSNKDRRMVAKSQTEFCEALNASFENTIPFAKRRMLLVGDSLRAAQVIGNGLLDFVFLDASHDYESVRTDMRVWSLKIRPGGVFAGHDYNGAGDRRGRFGVKRAVDEFMQMMLPKVALYTEAESNIWWFVMPND